MKIHQLNPSKLFFGKWLYRIECVQSGASRIKYVKIDTLENMCRDKSSKINDWHGSVDKKSLLEFIGAVKPFLKNKNLQIRTENKHFNFYCNDIKLVEKIDRAMNKWIRKISGPTTQEEVDFLTNHTNKKILCKTFPKNKYRYKIFLNAGISEEHRKNFYNWSKNYKDSICFTPSTKNWLSGEAIWWSTQPYFYVDNEKTLVMVGLYLGKNLRKLQEYILRGSVLRE